MENSNYRQRVVDMELARRLKSAGAILIEGAKWCGKSTTAAYHSASAIYMDDPSQRERYLMLADEDPQALLEGATPRLIDEWQLTPTLWDAVRFTVDHRPGFGQFLLTGSAKPADRSKIFHSGTGRFAWVRMRPMSLLESGESTGQVSLSALFDDPACRLGGEIESSLEKIAFMTCRGGWPMSLVADPDSAFDIAGDYLEAIVNVDIREVDGVDRSPERARKLMRSYARFQGTQTPVSQIVDDLNGNDGHNIDDKTVRSYLEALRNIFVIEDMPAWNPNLKSRTAVRTTDTRYFVDPSIAAAAMGLGSSDLLNDLKAFGLMFETLCIRDLRVYSQPLRGRVYHFRDKNGLECDAVIHLPNGHYGLIEIKLGGEAAINAGAESLLKLEAKIDTEKMPAPTFKMVLTAVGSYPYRRKDGVIVAPIRALGV